MNVRIAILLVLQTLLGAAAATAGSIDVIFYDSRFGTIDTSTGAYSQISTLPLGESAGIAASLDDLYVQDMNSNLLAVDPLTGVATIVGNSGLGLAALVFGGDNTGLFEIDSVSNLYSISPTTGKATLIGGTGLPPNLQASEDTSLSSDGSSLLFTAGRPGAGDELYRIDIATGQATALGNTGVTGVAGSAFIDGTLDLFQYDQATNYLYSAPDGSTTFIQGAVLGAQIIDGGAEPFAESSAQMDSIPEPATLLMVLSGICAIIASRSRSGKRVIPIQVYEPGKVIVRGT